MSDEGTDYIELDIKSTKIVSVKLDADVVYEIDRMVKKHNFRNRSEVIREALDFYIELLNTYNRREIKELRKMLKNRVEVLQQL